MFDIEKLKFDDKGLIPAIVVDDESGDVLTLAYMNKEPFKTGALAQGRNKRQLSAHCKHYRRL